MLVTLAAVGAGGLALAWVGRGLGPEPRDVAPGARPPRQAPAARAPEPAPPVAPSFALPVESPKTVIAPPRRHPARAPRGEAAPTADVVGALLAAADAARLAGRPRDAIVPLAEIASRHANDPRAAIAAFQLGRVFADDLHDTAQAARAFRRAYELDPGGPLARDARARAAEAAGGEGTQ
jgi:transmembrane sensor